MRLWECQALRIELEFRKLLDQAEYEKNVEPAKYWGILIMFFFSTLTSLSIYYLILLSFLSAFIQNFNGLEYNWVNSFF